MAVVAAPLLWPIAVEAAKTTVAIVGAAVAVIAVDEAVEAVDEVLDKREQEKPGASGRTADETCVQGCGQKKCPPCVPPAGTKWIERIDRVPPSRPHAGCPGDHVHVIQQNQEPYLRCNCHWNKAKPPVECMEPGKPLPYPMKKL